MRCQRSSRLRLELRQPGLHREFGLGQEQRRAPIARIGLGVHGNAVSVSSLAGMRTSTGSPGGPRIQQGGFRAYNSRNPLGLKPQHGTLLAAPGAPCHAGC